jgi:hypothetical protein
MAVIYLDYTIHLTDKAQVEALQAAAALRWFPSNDDGGAFYDEILGFNPFPDGSIYCAPTRAMALYGAPILYVGQAFAAPCITSAYITVDNSSNFPITSDKIVKESGGWFGIPALFGDSQTYRWRGTYAYAAGDEATVDGVTIGAGDPTFEAPQQLVALEGFELPFGGEGGEESGIAANVSRGASRHPDGLGLAIRGADGVKTIALTGNASLWFRFYFRLRKLPTQGVHFLRLHHANNSISGVALQLESTGRLSLRNINSSHGESSLATSGGTYELDRWYKCDILAVTGVSNSVRLFIGGAEVFNVTGTQLSNGGNFSSVTFGSETGTHGAYNAGIDIDDITVQTPPTNLTGLDWQNGTKIQRFEASGFAADHETAEWTGDWQACRQNPAHDGTQELTGATSEAVFAVTTNAEQTLNGAVGSRGCIGFIVGARTTRPAGPDGELGYSIQGAEPVMTAITEFNTPQWATASYFPADLAAPEQLTPIELHYIKGASAEVATIDALAGAAALVGVFGDEDIIEDDAGSPTGMRSSRGVHNSPFPNTPWARYGATPVQPVSIHGFTYVGTGEALEFTLPTPVHFLFARRVHATGLGWAWFSSLLAAHIGRQERTTPAAAVAIEQDPDFVPTGTEGETELQTIVRIVGDGQNWNDTGITYQVIAFCDPASRYALNDVLAYPKGTADIVTALKRSLFTPLATMLWKEGVQGDTINESLFWQGPGHVGAAVSPMHTSTLADVLTQAQGQLTSKAAIHHTGSLAPAIAFSCWRKDDTGTDTNKQNVVYVGTYTGDGTGNRTITLDATVTVRPLFAIVQGSNAGAHYRDPSNTGTTSLNSNFSSVAANGIRGGDLGAILVGSDLNANGIVYNVFVIWGDDVAGEAGWSGNGDFFPVAPNTGPVDPDDDLEGDEDWFDAEPPSSETTDPDSDLATGCVAASQKVCNRALSIIGITAQLTNLDTEDTVEAEQCRLHYAEAVDATLRAFPWPWATKYLELTLADGTDEEAVNHDWQYAYTHPGDCVFARRIVDQENARRKVRYGDPLPFKVGADADDAKIIYANLADDALFRQALAFQVAAFLAPGLARNKVTARDCLQAFDLLIGRAEQKAAAEQTHPDDGHGDSEWIRARG